MSKIEEFQKKVDDLQKELDELKEKEKQWAKEHPVVTNADKFREIFGVELKSSERYDGYCLLTGNDGIAKDSEEWLNQEYKEPEVEG